MLDILFLIHIFIAAKKLYLITILVNKSIHIKGVDGPIVDGENKETIFRFSADNFSISGLEIINVGRSYTKDFAAILVSKSDGFLIENNVFKHVFWMIFNSLDFFSLDIYSRKSPVIE